MTTPTPTQQGMSPGTRNLIIGLLAGAVVLCLIACAAILLITRQAGNLIGQNVVQEPEQVAQRAAEIADFTLPAGYKAVGGFNMLGITMAMYAGADERDMITFIQLPTSTEITEADIEQMRDAAERQAGRNLSNVKTIDTYSTTVRGQPAQVIIQEGTDANNATFRQMLVAFQGKGGTAMMMAVGPASGWNQKTYDRVLKSIK